MNINVGDEAIFLGQTQDGSISPIKATVQGIVDTGNGVFDRRAYVPQHSSLDGRHTRRKHRAIDLQRQ